MIPTRVIASATLVLAGLATSSAFAAEPTTNSVDPSLKPEAVRKQENKLLPPDEAREMEDKDTSPDQYQPMGVDLGSYLLMPKMEMDVMRNSNIYATSTNPEFDTITTYRPSLELKSRYDRHSVDALVRGERKVYDRFAKEDVTNGFAQVSGQYDISEHDTLNGTVSYVHDHEDRGSPDEAGGLRPTTYNYLTVSGSGTITTGRLTSTLGSSAVRRSWEDTQTSTGITPSHFRDRNEYEVKLRESYEFIDGYSALAEGSYNMRRYENSTDQFGYKRDSDGIRVGAGVGLDISEVIRGDFLAGAMQQSYEDERFQNVTGYYVKTSFNWMPTKLTTVIPSLERSVEESTAVNVTALVNTSASVTVRHELQRNIILSTDLSYSLDEQEGGVEESSIYSGIVRGTYLFDRNLYTSLEVGQKHKISNVDDKGFNQSTAMLRLGVQY